MELGEEDGPWSSGWAERCGCNTTHLEGLWAIKTTWVAMGLGGVL